jgi:hypothetical protein
MGAKNLRSSSFCPHVFAFPSALGQPFRPPDFVSDDFAFIYPAENFVFFFVAQSIQGKGA